MLLRFSWIDLHFLKDLRFSAVIFGIRKISIISENEINNCSMGENERAAGIIKISIYVAISSGAGHVS
jgi:hypothetical protein